MTEGDKEKLDAFVNFCEEAIFEMQHANSLMASDDDGGAMQARQAAYQLPPDEEELYLYFLLAKTLLNFY